MSDAALHGVADQLGDDALREAIRHRVEAAGTSFYWAMRLLPQDRRNGMYAVYAFCREVDDIADGDRPVEHKLAALGAWRQEIDALYGGRPHLVVARALCEPALRYGLRRHDFLAIIDGMEMDAREDIRAPGLAMLDLYCARVASAVGHLSVHVFGDASHPAHLVAESLGRALQLTNILRDLDEVCRGSIEPAELLRSRIGTASPWRERPSPAVPTDIVVDDRASPRHTVVETFAKDRPGLLYTLAQALHELGLTIALSKINTEGNKVADVFYVNELDGTKVLPGDRFKVIKETLARAIDSDVPDKDAPASIRPRPAADRKPRKKEEEGAR